eukprot:6204904-Pleurochrysis_carterae.AAC.2
MAFPFAVRAARVTFGLNGISSSLRMVMVSESAGSPTSCIARPCLCRAVSGSHGLSARSRASRHEESSPSRSAARVPAEKRRRCWALEVHITDSLAAHGA